MADSFKPLEKGQANWHDKYNEDMQALRRQYEQELAEIRAELAGKVDGRYLESGIAFYVAKSGSDEAGDGSKDNPFLTVGKALSVCRTIFGSFEKKIYVSPGVYDERMVLRGMRNMYLLSTTENPEDVIFRHDDLNALSLYDSGCEVIGITFECKPRGGSGIVLAERKSHITLYHCILTRTGGEGNGSGVVVGYGATGFVYECTINNTTSAMVAGDAGQISSRDCSGSDNNVSLQGYAGTIFYYGTIPGAISDIYEVRGGKVYG